ncbi:methyltransferase, FxLD system [Glycomyces xiaoerkulensis]|uniref:methyltransferase, FxLD system n=1 Tax=Glycomyces xiaoerkulensis TaxID=2038139 RepID=UPI0018E3FE2C|nr:methyltransferase, FxLD system [Glycomyces xiaoerkulensis]
MNIAIEEAYMSSTETDSTAAGAHSDGAEASGLLEAMLAELRELGALRSAPVEAAFRAVPRYRFAPGAPLEEVYAAREAVVTKRDAHGVAVSSVSAPEVQAFMLEQAVIEPGMRVLEIGSGGFNAALIAELVGPSGQVTTVDIDRDVTSRAAELLGATGYAQVEVACADASESLPGDGDWDRVIVTVGAWDLPPVWTDRLAPGGRLVVPLRMRGITRSLALELVGAHLEAVSSEVCGFVQLQGVLGHEERLFLLRGKDLGLRFDDANAPADMRPLDGAIAAQRQVVWTGVTTAAGESFASLEWYLAAVLPHFCLLAAAPGAAAEAGLAGEGERQFRPAHVDGDAFAYLLARKCEDGRFEFGAAAYGGTADQAATRMADQIRAWDDLRPDREIPAVSIWPRETEELPAGFVVDKRHRRIVLSWTERT